MAFRSIFPYASTLPPGTADPVPAIGLEQIGRAYAKIMDGINQLERRQLQPAL